MNPSINHKPNQIQVIEGFATFEDLEEKPVGEICLCAGFFFIYFVEELVHHIGADRITGHNHGAPARTLSRRSLRSSSSSSSSSDSDRKGENDAGKGSRTGKGYTGHRIKTTRNITSREKINQVQSWPIF